MSLFLIRVFAFLRLSRCCALVWFVCVLYWCRWLCVVVVFVLSGFVVLVWFVVASVCFVCAFVLLFFWFVMFCVR